MKHTSQFAALCDDARSRVAEITRDEMMANKANGDQFILIDVREKEEWDNGHLPDAIHLSKGVIEVKIAKQITDLSTPLVLYCGGGNRSLLAGDNLQKMGYTSVKSLIGGFRGWRDNDGEIVND